MAYSSPQGTSYYISRTFAAAKAITGISNANPAVCNAAGHGYVDGNELVLTSGWEWLNDSVYRADQLDTGTFGLVGLNSTNTNMFPSGTGGGTARLISDWIEIPQVLTINPEGGAPKFIDFKPIKAMQGKRLPNGFDPMSMTFGIGFDPSLPNWATLLDISRTQTLVAYKSVKGNGAATYGYGYYFMSEFPKQQVDNVDVCDGVFLAQGQVISYA